MRSLVHTQDRQQKKFDGKLAQEGIDIIRAAIDRNGWMHPTKIEMEQAGNTDIRDSLDTESKVISVTSEESGLHEKIENALIGMDVLNRTQGKFNAAVLKSVGYNRLSVIVNAEGLRQIESYLKQHPFKDNKASLSRG